MKHTCWLVVAALAAIGCGGSGTVEGGILDAGRSDAGTSQERDAGEVILPADSGEPGEPDGSTAKPDAGTQPDEDAGLGAYADAEVPLGDAGCESDPCQPVEAGCGSDEVCGDGLDNNCNGRIDEYCPCTPGKVQRCFLGPPGRRGIGVCSDGQQTCQGSGELGHWSDCVGGIWPSNEICDDADNDCDGCADENLCCQALGSCPSNQDPRVPEGNAFETYRLDGAAFFFGPAKKWEWKVEGGPCDRMLFAANHVVSYEVQGAGSDPRRTEGQHLAFTPTLSGDYTVSLTVTQQNDEIFECVFMARVRAPGMRVELCWDTSGEDDLDLWVHQPGSADDWARGNATCMYNNCRNEENPEIDWGYPVSTGGACREATASGACQNPRLDIDNIREPGVPENINVDVPRDGDTFRVAVNFYGCDEDHDPHADVHPMINIYCGGELVGTFGGAQVNGELFGSSAISGYSVPGSNSRGSLWRVVDVTMHEPADTCTLTPLVPIGASSGACVDNSRDRTYDGPCRRQ
jgi:hypothetical protein